jgi:nucleoside-diphosphate-sugar epimerase
MFIPELIGKALAGRPFEMTEGRQRRRFTHVRDAVDFLLDYGRALRAGEELPPLLNAPACGPISMREVAEKLAALIGRGARLEVGALPMRDSEVLDQWPDDSLALELGFSCETGLDEGLAGTVAWYRDNGWFLERGI